MSNIGFLRQDWPEISADCVRGEPYLAADARSACFYARRAAEQLVGHGYPVDQLRVPYRDDLAARIADPAFARTVPLGITTKLTLIRKLGNTAVHDQRPIPPQAALDAVRELFRVVVWTAQRYSPVPGRTPVAARFDPALAQRAASARDRRGQARRVRSRCSATRRSAGIVAVLADVRRPATADATVA